MSALRRDGNDFLLFCRVQPRARTNAFAEVRDNELLIKLTAPPLDDRANQALREFVGASFDVPTSRVRIETGDRARHKRIRVTGATGIPAALRALGLDCD